MRTLQGARMYIACGGTNVQATACGAAETWTGCQRSGIVELWNYLSLLWKKPRPNFDGFEFELEALGHDFGLDGVISDSQLN